MPPAFTGPSAITFLHIATGWCRSKLTVTNLVRTIGDELLGHTAKHWINYEYFFYRASWSLQALSTSPPPSGYVLKNSGTRRSSQYSARHGQRKRSVVYTFAPTAVTVMLLDHEQATTIQAAVA